MLPFLDVSHLPSSASFYAAVLQPLGLRYISGHGTSSELSQASLSFSPQLAITYGTLSPPTPVLQIREAPQSLEPLKPSHIVFSAPSPKAVADFQASALRANPSLLATTNPTLSLRPSTEPAEAVDSGETRARITDFDGNIMEVAYLPPPQYPSRYNGSTIRRTQSTEDEVSRILHWNYAVATSLPAHSTTSRPAPSARPSLAMARRPGRFPDDEPPYTVIRRSVTTSTIEPSPRQNSSGLSTGAVVGAILGVAAAGAAIGAATTYTMLKSERARAPRQEFDAPVLPRRSTFPEPYGMDRHGRYVEVERTVEKIRYPEDYAPRAAEHRSPPQYMARYSQIGTTRGRELEDVYDDSRSRHSSRFKLGRSQSVRSRSETPAERAPLLLTEGEHRSHVSSRHTVHSKPIHQRPVVDLERDSYVSARSHRSSSTARPPPPPLRPTQSELVSRSKAPSRATTVMVASHSPSVFPPNASRSHSIMSARKVALPPSAIGSSHADWDDDEGSVAPSDSISCVGGGSRSSHGRRYR
jgi:hypothetical protein